MINMSSLISRILKTIVASALCLPTLWAMHGCAEAATPDNLEPAIEMLPADGITRTEAVIAARVEKRGTGSLSYVEFYYGTDGDFKSRTPEEAADGQTYTMHLQGLKPGTTYSCYAIGGTASATLRSETVSFTTIPNELPAVSAPVALSTGPVGIIVEFEITDDGGEPVLEAGCEIENTATSKTERVYLPQEDLTEGAHRLHISGLAQQTRYTITPFASNSMGESRGPSLEFTTQNTIALAEAGSLQALFAGIKRVDLERLSISGPMNGDDFHFLRILLGAPALPGETPIESAVEDVNLSDVNIVEGGGPFDGSRFTTADELSTGLLADCAGLRRIALPATATVLARDAFARCSALAALEISAEIKSLKTSEGCTSLAAIEVSQANTCFAAADGVLFDREVTSIVWFPAGKTGDYSLPATVTAIGENAFYGTSVTSLQIPPSVTSIGRGAFTGSSLTEIALPDNITHISEGMFQNCSSLAVVRLGSGTEFVGDYAFDGTCIRDLYVAAPIPPFAAERAFFDSASSITARCTLHVPAGSKAMYRNNRNWGLFSKIVEFTP